MHPSLKGPSRHLPKRFPVGATYVVEGRSSKDGDLCVSSRYVVLPGGRRINLPADAGRAAASPRALASRRRRQQVQAQSRRARRSLRPGKKFTAKAGTGRH